MALGQEGRAVRTFWCSASRARDFVADVLDIKTKQ